MNPNNPSVEISVPIVNDTIFEFSEYFSASLIKISGDANQEVLLDPASAEIKIQDDDGESIIYNNNKCSRFFFNIGRIPVLILVPSQLFLYLHMAIFPSGLEFFLVYLTL